MIGVEVDNRRKGQKVFDAVEGAVEGLGTRILEDDSLFIVQVMVEVGLQGQGGPRVTLPVQFVQGVLHGPSHPSERTKGVHRVQVLQKYLLGSWVFSGEQLGRESGGIGGQRLRPKEPSGSGALPHPQTESLLPNVGHPRRLDKHLKRLERMRVPHLQRPNNLS